MEFYNENIISLETERDFLPRNELARIAVLKSRETVRNNNELIQKIKEFSNISEVNLDVNREAEFFNEEDSYSFDLYKIKSKIGISDYIKDIFGI